MTIKQFFNLQKKYDNLEVIINKFAKIYNKNNKINKTNKKNVIFFNIQYVEVIKNFSKTLFK